MMNRTKKFFRLRFASLFVLAAATFSSCGTDNTSSTAKNTPKIAPPVADIDILQPNEKEVSAKDGGVLEYETGSKVIIPKGAFVDANGQPVEGNVKINFKEYRTPVEAMMSGIPMTYTDNGKVENFESAGMFDIAGKDQNDQPIFVSPKKQITIQMTSSKDDEDFDFWKMEKGKAVWSKQEKQNDIVENKEKEEAKKELEEIGEVKEPIKPEDAEESDRPTFQLDVDTDSFPELAGYNKMYWRFSNPEDDKNKVHIFSKQWDKITLSERGESEGQFVISMSNSRQQERITVNPVFKGKSYKKAMKFFKKEMKKIKKEQERKKNLERIAKLQGDFIRSAQISGFGIYNWDRYLKAKSNLVEFQFELSVKNHRNLETVGSNIYLISKEANAMINYTGYKSMRLDADETNFIMVFLPNGKAGYMAADELKDQIPIIRRYQKEQKPYPLKLKYHNKKITSIEDIDKIFASLN